MQSISKISCGSIVLLCMYVGADRIHSDSGELGHYIGRVECKDIETCDKEGVRWGLGKCRICK